MNLDFVLITLYLTTSVFTGSTLAEFPQEVYLANYEKDTEQALFDSAALNIVRSLDWLRDEYDLGLFAESNISSSCNHDFAIYTDGLQPRGFTKWAIKMADSTGKFESGILDGNAVFEGRYRQCVNVNTGVKNPPITPLYCLATWWSVIPTETPVYISGLGICIPESCSDDDAAILLDTVYAPWIQANAEVAVMCKRDSDDLSTDAAAIISIVILCLFGVLVLVASMFDAFKDSKPGAPDKNKAIPTYTPASVGKDNQSYINNTYITEPALRPPQEFLDAWNNTKANTPGVRSPNVQMIKPKDSHIELKSVGSVGTYELPSMHENGSDIGNNRPGLAVNLLLCFSLYRNLPLIVSAKQPGTSIRCLNGLRVIAMCCVVLGHTYASGYITFDNWKVFWEASQKLSYQSIATMDVYVDTFFILSAFLVTISFLKHLKRCNGKLKPIDLALHYFNRYWRLTPIYMLILMVYSNLSMYMIPEGPFKFESNPDMEDCSTEWWKNMLYINIYWGKTGKQCMGVSWYLCVDMQLFIIAPVFLYLLYRWEKLGIGAVVAAICGGVTANIVLWQQYYSQSAGDPDPVDVTWDIYMMPWTRCPVYFMGMLLGFLFYKTDGNIKLPKVVVALGWLVALSLFFITTYLPMLDDCVHVAVLYLCEWGVAGQVTWSTLYRPMWGLWVCWVILACHSGYGGIINSVLSWSFFVPLGRLTFLGYLIHMIVINIYFFGSAVSPYFTHLYLVYAYFGILLTTYMSALVCAASLSAPLVRLAAVFLPGSKHKAVR